MMKVLSRLVLAFSLLLSSSAFSKENAQGDRSHALSFNAGNFVLMSGVGLAIQESTGDGLFLPFHFSYHHRSESGARHEVDFIYRYDSHGTFAGYHEFIGLYGRRFEVGEQGWTFGIKGGLGYVSGPVNNQVEDLFGNISTLGPEVDYTCFQGAIKADLKNETPIGENWSLSYGGGFLFVIPLSCENTPDWSTLGILVHRVVPVLDLSLKVYF